MVRFLTIIFLFISTLSYSQVLGKTETEDYKAAFEEKQSIEEVSDYDGDIQVPIQVLNIGFTPELYEFYPELKDNRVGLGVANITLSYLEWTDRFIFTEDKEEIKQRMIKQHIASTKGISQNQIQVKGNVILAKYFVYVEIYDYSVSEEEEITKDGIKVIQKTIIGMQVRFVDAETGSIFTGSGSGEAVTIKRSNVLDGLDEIKFNQSTIGISTKKSLETASARIVKKMIKRGIFTE
ncbi:hypothetical protein N9Z41_00430 [bacterium]|nr:hypothetical protein [bacterium]